MAINAKDINDKLNTPAPDIYSSERQPANDTPPEQSEIFTQSKLSFQFDYERLADDFQDIMSDPKPIKTGIEFLDNHCGGFYQGITVIGAVSKVGKTALACNLAYNIAGKGVKTLFISLENRRRHIMERLHALHAETYHKYYSVYNDKEFYSNEVFPLQDTNFAIKNSLVFDFKTKNGIIDKTVRNIEYLINNFCDFIRKRYGEEQEILIILDHLQHIENDNDRDDDYKTVNKAFKTFEKITENKGVKMLCLSQLNRLAYKTVREQGILMENFKFASRIEQAAVMCLGLSNGDNGEKRLNICGNRFNKTFDGFIYLSYNGISFKQKRADKQIDFFNHGDENDDFD